MNDVRSWVCEHLDAAGGRRVIARSVKMCNEFVDAGIAAAPGLIFGAVLVISIGVVPIPFGGSVVAVASIPHGAIGFWAFAGAYIYLTDVWCTYCKS